MMLQADHRAPHGAGSGRAQARPRCAGPARRPAGRHAVGQLACPGGPGRRKQDGRSPILVLELVSHDSRRSPAIRNLPYASFSICRKVHLNTMFTDWEQSITEDPEFSEEPKTIAQYSF